MSSQAPEKVDPWRAADQNRHITFAWPASELERLQAVLCDRDGGVEAELEFYRDEQRRPCIRGRVKAELPMQCQRCMQTARFQIDSSLSLGIVSGPEEAAGLPEEYDPLQVDEDGLVRLRELVEEELLLSLPQVPMHDPGVCQVQTEYGDDLPTQAEEETETENPFAVLASLKPRESDTH